MSQAVARERWAMSVEAKGLFVVTGTLLAFGLAVLYSASALEATRNGFGSTHYVKQQLLGVIVGGGLFAAAAKLDAEKLREWAWYFMFASGLSMLIIVLPFAGSLAPSIHGSNRFLSIAGITVQPSEFAKLAVILWTAMLVVKKGGMMRHLLKGVTPFLLVVGTLAMLAALEPDVSLALTLLLIMGVILFASGARIGHFLFLGAMGTPVLWRWITTQEYVLKRFDFILNPGGGFEQVAPQLKQSLIAVGSGQLFGQGFGQGMQQAGWVSMGFNDFVGSVIGEEWGFLGMLFVISLFSLYAWLGFRIAQNARTRYQQLVAIGITFTIVLTAFVHLGVVIGLLPTTGLTLPFISHGRSNLLVSLVMTGILVNIGSVREKVFGSPETEEERLPVASVA